ncbi:MAG: hypothetical protein ACOYKA_00655 [Legionellaceae bacterium]
MKKLRHVLLCVGLFVCFTAHAIQYTPHSSGDWNGAAPGVNVTDPMVWSHPGVNVTSPVQNNMPSESRYPHCILIKQCNAFGNCSQRQVCND